MIMPHARKDGLVVQELPDETLVYDLDRDRALCLNRASSLVWRHCDGITSVAQVATYLRGELDDSMGDDVVWLALRGLEKTHLLAEKAAPPGPEWLYTRREVLKTMGKIGISLLLPVVVNIIAPTAASAATCVSSNACSGMPDGTPCGPPSCSKICCLGKCRQPTHADCP